ncbi:MAG: hypothetical protein VZQ29_08595, partial [Succiniclasticum sp.]|nr:hypothetical protein [Succiniclasticum sp.]
SGCHFVFLPLGICVDFQKCVDFWFRLKKCVDLRRFFSFVGLYQSWQGFFGKVHIPYGSIHIRKYLQPAAGAFYSSGPDLPAVFIRFCGVQAA